MRNATALLIGLFTLPSVGSAQLILPFSGTDATATISSFQIIKSGSLGRANTLYITNPSNTSDVLLVNTVGKGRSAYFSINNVANSAQAIRGDSNGSGVGVFGLMTGTGRGGVFRITNPANTNYALFAETDGTGSALKVNAGMGLAGEFVGGVKATASGTALYGASTNDYGVLGQGSSGVYGSGTSTGLYGTGVYYGAIGYGPTGVYGSGGNYGTYGYGGAVGAFGDGTAYGVKGVGPIGVYGQSAYGGASYGVYGSSGYIGVVGSGNSQGVRGTSPYVGVWAEAGSYGVYGLATGTSGQNYGGFFQTASAAGYALWVNGRSATTGTKSFVIDHPLDPANKVLNHFCTEAPEPLNAYSGNIVTDENGYATVQLPDYFESINKDFRYQLTPLDGSDDFVQVKVSRRIQANTFVIRSSKPGVEVSWRVEGVRNDAWVQKNGFKAVETKSPANRGKYYEPTLYGQPAEKGINYMNVTPKATGVAPRHSAPSNLPPRH